MARVRQLEQHRDVAYALWHISHGSESKLLYKSNEQPCRKSFLDYGSAILHAEQSEIAYGSEVGICVSYWNDRRSIRIVE